MACRCGYAGVSEPTRVDSVCLQCGRLIDSKKWDGATSSEIDSAAGPHLISSTSLSRGSKYEGDDDGGPDETMTAKSEDPPGLVCKVIVLMCGIATFARTECILLQTVLFAECECCTPHMHVRARFPHTFHPLFSKVSWGCALPRIRLLCASGSELVSEPCMSNHSHTRRAGHASAEIHALVSARVAACSLCEVTVNNAHALASLFPQMLCFAARHAWPSKAL
jgi:hypothetical protein